MNVLFFIKNISTSQLSQSISSNFENFDFCILPHRKLILLSGHQRDCSVCIYSLREQKIIFLHHTTIPSSSTVFHISSNEKKKLIVFSHRAHMKYEHIVSLRQHSSFVCDKLLRRILIPLSRPYQRRRIGQRRTHESDFYTFNNTPPSW